MPLVSGSSASTATRLLAFATDLLGDLELLDLDTIDGEFYWRWCRADLLEPASALPAKLPRAIGAAKEGAESQAGIYEPAGLFDYLREGLRFVRDLLAFSDRLAQQYPRIVWQRLLDGERIAMRAAEAEFVTEDLAGGSHRVVRLRVYSGAWTGQEVEDEVRRLAFARYDDLVQPATPPDSIALHLRFEFVSEKQARKAALDDEPLRAPYVLVVAPLPLPPEKTIAREYEALVRHEHGWHLELPGSGSRQEKVVAVRTWAIGLLVHEGVPVNEAIDVVCLHLNLAPISQSCFGGDRKRLFERVPEAIPYLHAPTGRDTGDTSSEPLDPLVSADHVSV